MHNMLEEKIHYWETLLQRGQSDLISETFHSDMTDEDRLDLERQMRVIEQFVYDLKQLRTK